MDPASMDLKGKYAEICKKYAKICINMQAYAKYAIMKFICTNMQKYALPTLLMGQTVLVPEDYKLQVCHPGPTVNLAGPGLTAGGPPP